MLTRHLPAELFGEDLSEEESEPAEIRMVAAGEGGEAMASPRAVQPSLRPVAGSQLPVAPISIK